MNRGVTIIELLLVISLILIVGLMSTAFYGKFLNQNAVQNGQNQIAASFRKAQTYSMMGKQNGVWGVKYTETPTKKITLYLTGNPAFDENYDVNSSITITLFDITFARITGLPSGGTFPVTITVSDGINSKSVSINNQGVVSKTD